MTPYCTIHEAPMPAIIQGILHDIPRYESEKTVITARQTFGRGFTPRARQAQIDILEIIKAHDSIGTVQIAKLTGRSRCAIHCDVTIMAEEGMIKRFQRGKLFFWEVV